VILVLVVMLSLAGFTFMTRMATEYEATLVGGNLRQARQTLASAESLLLVLAEEHAGQPEPWNPLQHDARLFASRTVDPAPAGGSSEYLDTGSTGGRLSWRFSILKGLEEFGRDRTDTESVRAGGLQFGLVNESAKLHLGLVMGWEMERPGSGRNALLRIPGMTADAADGILDWIDDDAEVREFGAEADYYKELDSSYEPRNGLPETLDELLFVRGVTRDMFYGVAEPQQDGDVAGGPWENLLTVASAEPNADRFGVDRIDLNDIYPSEYVDVTGETQNELSFLPEDVVKYILLARLYGIRLPLTFGEQRPLDEEPIPAEDPAAFIELSEVQLPDDESLDLEEIQSVADLIGSVVQLPITEADELQEQSGKWVHSPLQIDSPQFQENMNLLQERVTIDRNERVYGRVNINLASEPVLRALLGDAGLAAQVAEQRSILADWQRESTAWLVIQKAVDLQTYRRLYSQITTRGAVHSAEIVVYRKIGGPFIRRQLTIDASVTPAVKVHWKDLTPQGLPVSLSALRSTDSEQSVEF